MSYCPNFQDPNADTEWNDALRRHGILPAKEEKAFTEEEIVNLVENTVQEKLRGFQFLVFFVIMFTKKKKKINRSVRVYMYSGGLDGSGTKFW